MKGYYNNCINFISNIELDLKNKIAKYNAVGDLLNANLKELNFSNNNIQLTGLLDVNFTPNTFYKASDSLLFSETSSGIVSFNPNLVFRSNIDYTIYPVELRYFDKKRIGFFR